MNPKKPTFATPGGRYDRELKRRVSWWKHGEEHFPRTKFPAGSRTKAGKSIDLQTGEVAEAVVAGLLDECDPKELAMGIKVEKEHTSDPKKAEKIAKDHLKEPGNARYYTRLKKSGLADELKESEPCPNCAHGTKREQQLARLQWTCFWGAGVWLNPKSTYQVSVNGIEDYPEEEWQQILSMTNAERPGSGLRESQSCECRDPGCPVCQGRCSNRAVCNLRRADMMDRDGTFFCDQCAGDALKSGVFGAPDVGNFIRYHGRTPRLKPPPKADIMPGGSVGGPAGDSTAIGGGGSAAGV